MNQAKYARMQEDVTLLKIQRRGATPYSYEWHRLGRMLKTKRKTLKKLSNEDKK